MIRPGGRARIPCVSIFQSSGEVGLECEACGTKVSIPAGTYVELIQRFPSWTLTMCPCCRSAREVARMQTLPAAPRTDVA